MIIPNKIRIGEHNYTISKCWKVDWKNNNVVGQINYNDKKIRLKDCNTDERINEDNFFHEIAHGMLKELEFNHPKISVFRNDEGFVQEIGLLMRKTFLDLMNKQAHKKAPTSKKEV